MKSSEELHKFLEVVETTVDTVFNKKDTFKEGNSKSIQKNKIPKEVRLVMRQKKEISDRIKKSRSWLNTLNLTKLLEEKELKLREMYRQRKLKVENEALRAMKSNPKHFYSYARKSSKTSSQVGTLVDKDGRMFSKPLDKAECLSQQYKSVFTTPDPKYKVEDIDKFCNIGEPAPGLEGEAMEPHPCARCELQVVHECWEDLEPAARRLEEQAYWRRNPTTPNMSDILPTIDDMVDAITKIPNNSSPGQDGIPPCILKNAKQSIAAMLLDMFKLSYETGEIPALWKLGIITPIHKGGSTSNPANFRPVSLTSHVMKTMERVVRKNLVTHLEVMGKMDQNQHGSRQGRSTLSQLLEHHNEIVTCLENNENVDVIYLDFAKAFDKCDLGILMHKLKALGITGKVARWIYNFAMRRKQKVVVSGTTSESTELISGVAQGTVLGPILFLIYVADISDNIDSNVKEYVDDTKVKRPITNEHDIEKLQEDLDRIYNWAKQNNMKFNGTKFQVVKYGKNDDLKNENEYFTEDTDEIIERYETLRDLGVILSDTAKFDKQIESVAKKTRQKAGWVLRTFYSRNTQFMKSIYKTLVVPHVDYCSQLWMPTNATGILTIEKLQQNYFNRIPSLKHLNYWQKLKQMKMISLQRRQERYRVLYVWKTLQGLVPNCGITVQNTPEDRVGRTCRIPRINTGATAAAKSLREQSFQVNGAQLFNSLPPFLRNMTTCSLDEFKERLDKYLERVPDEPSVAGLTPGACTPDGRPSNSLLHQRPVGGTRRPGG